MTIATTEAFLQKLRDSRLLTAEQFQHACSQSPRYGERWARHWLDVKEKVNDYDYHATLLHLFGISHEHLTYRRNNQELTLTDGQDCRIVSELPDGRANANRAA